MPLITPPPNDVDFLELEPVDSDIPVFTQSEHERIKEFLNVPNWICNECMSVNFGRNQKCAYCFGRRGRIVARPT